MKPSRTPASLVLPIRSAHATNLGVHRLHIDARLWVQGADATFRPMRFRVDTGCQLTLLSESTARRYNLPVDVADPPMSVALGGSTGGATVSARRGRLGVRFAASEPVTPFYIPVLFVLSVGPLPLLLGLSGVIDQMMWHLDGREALPEHPFGFCRFQDVR